MTEEDVSWFPTSEDDQNGEVKDVVEEIKEKIKEIKARSESLLAKSNVAIKANKNALEIQN